MSELLNGVKLKFELPFKIPTPVSFPFESIGTFRPITRIPKYDYSLEKTIVKEIAKRKQEDQYDQLRQAQQQLSMVDIIASRKSRHKGKEPDRNSTFGTSSEPNILVRPSSESGVSRPAKSKAADIAASSEQLPASLSASNRNDLSTNVAVQKSGAAVAEMKAPSVDVSDSSLQQPHHHHNAPSTMHTPVVRPELHTPNRPQSAGAATTNSAQQSSKQFLPTTFQGPAAPPPASAEGTGNSAIQSQVQSQAPLNSANHTQHVIMAPSTASAGGSSTVGYVPSGQRTQRPLMQMQYLSSPQLPNQQRQQQQYQHQHQQMFTPVSSIMHQSHQPPNSSPIAYHQTPSSGTQQPMMQTGSPLMKDSGHQGPGQPFLGMTSMMQPQQNSVTPPNDLRFNNRFSSSFGTSPAVANSSTPSSTSIPALPPKPDELKPYAHKASGSPTSHTPQPAATSSVPSTGPARPQFKYGYGPIVPPPLPKRRNDTQGQQPPALPPKPFASFSEFDYTTDGPGALGSGSQTEHVEQLNTLLSMGFSRPHAIHALEMHDYDVNMASNYLIDKSSS